MLQTSVFMIFIMNKKKYPFATASNITDCIGTAKITGSQAPEALHIQALSHCSEVKNKVDIRTIKDKSLRCLCSHLDQITCSMIEYLQS